MAEAALGLFASGAGLGAFFVLLGPVPFVRGLGAFALFAALAGCALQLHLLGASPRAVLHLWRRRIPAFASRLRAPTAKASVPVLPAARLAS